MGGGAWPFLVRGVICLVNSANERDLVLLIRDLYLMQFSFRRTMCAQHKEARGNNRSVMPLDALGSTRVTLMQLICFAV